MREDHPNPFESEDVAPVHRPVWDARRRIAGALRRLAEAAVTSAAPAADLDEIAALLERQVHRLEQGERCYGRLQHFEDGGYGNFGEVGHELNAVSGWSNPVAPPLNTELVDGEARARVRMGWCYEGPPGSVHGGFVAALLDQFLGEAQQLAGQPGFTGTLTVRYLQRTPLDTHLDLRARVERVEGRKTFVRGEIYAGQTLTATGEGIFVQPREGYAPLGYPVAADGSVLNGQR